MLGLKLFLTLCLFIATTHAFTLELLTLINDFNSTQQNILKRLNTLSEISQQIGTDLDFEKEVDDRLAMLENRVAALTYYLMKEKISDRNLKDVAKNTIKDMKEKVRESEIVIKELKRNVAGSLVTFDDKINKVNRTAHLTVNVKGVVFIGSIGSTCSLEAEDCQLPDSECRDGKCQCKVGFSFDNEINKCTDQCKEYGCTLQSARRRIIRDFNDKTVENVTLSECKALCMEEKDFVCKSFDYFPRWTTCYMSQSTKIDVPSDKWEYNSAGTHFQRDCMGIKELSLCNENLP